MSGMIVAHCVVIHAIHLVIPVVHIVHRVIAVIHAVHVISHNYGHLVVRMPQPSGHASRCTEGAAHFEAELGAGCFWRDAGG